jgi:ankyrin repeat protein
MNGGAQCSNSTTWPLDIREKSECAFSAKSFLKTDCGGREVDTVTQIQVCLVLLLGDISTYHCTAVPDAPPSHVSFEVLGADGKWSACAHNEENVEANPISEHHITSATSPGTLLEDTNVDSNQHAETPVIAPPDQMLGEFTIELPPEEVARDLNISGSDFMHINWHDVQMDSISDVDSQTIFEIWTSGNYDLAQFYSSALHDLPFKRFQNELKKRGMFPNHQFPAIVSKFTYSPGIDLRSLRPKSSAIRTYGTSKFATPFLRDIESSIASTMSPGDARRYVQPTLSLLAFQSLLPGEVSFKQYEQNLNLMATNVMLEANFTEVLVFSITNGFAGLTDMPIAGVFKFLSRYGSVNAVFSQILQGSPRHVAKSLAENLIKIAIEAQESDVVMQLLKTPLVQANEIVCRIDMQKMTAAERATELRDLKTLKVLIGAGADVNKTFPTADENKFTFLDEGTCLNRLIGGIQRGETAPNVIDIIQLLLEAGAKTNSTALLRHVLQNIRHLEIAHSLLLDLIPVHHTYIISERILSMIIQQIEQEQTREATIQILQACKNHHKGECFQKFEDEVEWALVESAIRGHGNVVQLLLPYTTRLDRVLTASFRGGSREVIEIVLARMPAFDFPAVCIDSLDPFNRPMPNGPKTTPLAEAILSKMDDLITLCETASAPDLLHLDGHLKAAITAAATTGNSSLLDKLLQHRPNPEDLSYALSHAILNGHEDIALQLITFGAGWGRDSSRNDFLLYGLQQRNAKVVRAILEWTSIAQSRGSSRFLDEAIRWGDKSIISDLHSAFPAARILNLVFPEETLAAKNEKNFLAFLIALDLVETSALTECLSNSIQQGDVTMVYYLLELGAEPSDSKSLSLAAQHQPAILKILLEHIPRTNRPRKGLGTEATLYTVDCGLAGLASLEMLLLSEVVDFRSFSRFPSDTFEDEIQLESPLGLAIKRAVYYKGEFPVVRSLLEAGCDPNGIVVVPDWDYISSMTALLAAVHTKSIGLVNLLLEWGADVNTQTTRGLRTTPLQLAAGLGCLEIVQLLIKEGAQVNASPARRAGGTALQFAAISGNCNIAAELLSHGADPEAPPSNFHGRWPIEGAAEHGRLDMIDYLLKVTLFNAEKCRRAMELAQENGHMGCYDLILEHVQSHETGGMDMTGMEV